MGRGRRVWQRCEAVWSANVSTLACAFAALALIFGLIATIQRIELTDGHFEVEWGSVPDWLVGLGTIGLFGALLVASLEWRAGQADRRDEEAAQARLVIVEPFEEDGQFQLVIRNHSQLPVFNVLFEGRATAKRMNDENGVYMTVDGIEVAYHSNVSSGPLVLLPGQAVDPLWVDLRNKDPDSTPRVFGPEVSVKDPDHAVFAYTDARGKRWRRTGSDQPVPVHTVRG